jgi:predicted MFS family arabinose efflux permease
MTVPANTGARRPVYHPRVTKPVGKWGALGILMVLAFLNYMDRNLVYPVLPLIAKDLHISVEKLGALATGFHVVYALTAPLMGAVSDRVARKTLLLMAVVGWSLITALSGTATSFMALLVWRSLTGLGEGGYFPTAVSLIGDLFRSNQRGLALALHGTCAALGGSAGYALGGVLGEQYGWRASFGLVLVPGLLLAFILYRSLAEPPRGMTEARPSAGARRSYWATVTSVPVLLISLVAGLAAFAMMGMNTFLPMYLVEVREVTVSKAGVLTGAFYVLAIVGQLSGGLLADRLASRMTGARPLLVAAPYAIAAAFVVAIPHVATVMTALVCYGVTQIIRGFAEPNIYGTVLDSTPPNERGSAQGFLLMMSFVGASASGWGIGALIKSSGFTVALHTMGGVSATAGALGVVLVMHLRRAAGARSLQHGMHVARVTAPPTSADS